jgi:putative serine protease PepD
VVTLEGATSTATIQVKLSDGRIAAARLVGTDPTNDLAVVKVDANGLLPATFADSSKLNVGDSVLAIGAPLGLDATVTKGIISTLNRTIDEASSAPNAISGATIHMSVIQTDAAINPGNSGGALVDSNGNVVGINVAIATAGSSSLGGQAGNIGVGFAIPANVAQRIANDIMANGTATHGLLGAQIYNNADTNTVDAFSNGAKVDALTAGGAGEKAGLKKGDVIVKVNDSKVTSASDLTALVRQQPAGATVKLTVIRGTATITVTVVLGNADSIK